MLKKIAYFALFSSAGMPDQARGAILAIGIKSMWMPWADLGLTPIKPRIRKCLGSAVFMNMGCPGKVSIGMVWIRDYTGYSSTM